MTAELVTSHGNATIKRLKSLWLKKHRREHGLFLAEGLRIVAEAVEAGWTPEVLVFGSDHAQHPLVRRLAHATTRGRGRVIETTAEILSSLTGKDNPQAVVGAFAIPDTSLERLERARSPRFLVAQAVRDPGNLGTMLRTCDATGAGGLVLLDDCADPHSVEAVRASMGARFTVAVAQARLPAFLQWLRREPATLIGAALDPRAVDYTAAAFPAPSFILMGNEQMGLPPEHRDACDALVSLPMLGKADSLNVAVAAAVLLYRCLEAQRGAQPPES